MIDSVNARAELNTPPHSFEANIDSQKSAQKKSNDDQNIFVKKTNAYSSGNEADIGITGQKGQFDIFIRENQSSYTEWREASMSQRPKGWVPFENSIRKYKEKNVFHPMGDFTMEYTSKKNGKKIIASTAYLRADNNEPNRDPFLERPNAHRELGGGLVAVVPIGIYALMAKTKETEADPQAPMHFIALTRNGNYDITDDLQWPVQIVQRAYPEAS